MLMGLWQRRRLLWSLVACTALAVGTVGSARPAEAAGSTPIPLVQDHTFRKGRGFGSTWNRYAWSMAEFRGHLYVGTWNVQMDYPKIAEDLESGVLDPEDLDENPLSYIRYTTSTGAEIWRSKNRARTKWERVFKADAANAGFRKMVVFDDKLYAGTENAQGPTSLFYSSDGKLWKEQTGGPTENPENGSNRAMAVIGGRLYLGTENNVSGGELWSLGTGGDWQLEAKLPDDTSVSEIAEFEGKIYLGTWDFTDHYSLFRLDDTNVVVNVTPQVPALQGLFNIGVMALMPFNGQLYLGTVNYLNGFTLVRTPTPDVPASWQVITKNGFQSEVPGVTTADNAYSWSMVEMNGTLFLGTFNHGITGGIYAPLPIPMDGRAQLFSSTNGADWNLLVPDGFGSPFTYGFRTLVAGSDGRLYIGTASHFMLPDMRSSLYRGHRLSPQDPRLNRVLPWTLMYMIGNQPRRRPFIGTQVFSIPVGLVAPK